MYGIETPHESHFLLRPTPAPAPNTPLALVLLPINTPETGRQNISTDRPNNLTFNMLAGLLGCLGKSYHHSHQPL